MPDSALTVAALVAVFRRRKQAGTLTAEQLETYVTNALSALASGTTIVSLTFEGGGSGAQVNCNPDILLAAVKQVKRLRGRVVRIRHSLLPDNASAQ